MAPGEGRILTNLTLDDDAEELSFPTISCGEIFKGNSTYAKKSKIANSLLRPSLRSSAQSPLYVQIL